MKILYDYRIFSLQRYGGISRYFYELLKNIITLKSDNIKIFLFEGIHVNNYDLHKLKKRMESYWGIKRPYIKRTLNIFYTLNKILFSFYTSSKPFNKKDSIYHPTYYASDISNFKNKTKIILTVYDMIHEKLPEYFYNVKNEIEIKKESINNADKIICISNNTKKDLINYYNIDDKKVKVIYPGPNLKYHQNHIKELKNKRSFILFIGKRAGYKNFKTLLNSYYLGKLYKDHDLICFGGEDFSIEEKAQIKKFGLKNEIKLIRGGDDLLASLYKNAICLIYPSLYEGFGMPILEAMNFGCPVLSSCSSSMTEIGGNAVIFFKPTNEEDLTNKLKIIIKDKKLRSKMVQKGFEQIKKFSWERNAEETLKLYKECLDE